MINKISFHNKLFTKIKLKQPLFVLVLCTPKKFPTASFYEKREMYNGVSGDQGAWVYRRSSILSRRLCYVPYIKLQ